MQKVSYKIWTQVTDFISYDSINFISSASI